MPKKQVDVEVVAIPVTLARLLMAEKSDFKDPTKYEDGQKVAKSLLKVIVEASK